jgi:ppGpp synthetase/RelA/SpoT-type nucleotidyltranferase
MNMIKIKILILIIQITIAWLFWYTIYKIVTYTDTQTEYQENMSEKLRSIYEELIDLNNQFNKWFNY